MKEILRNKKLDEMAYVPGSGRNYQYPEKEDYIDIDGARYRVARPMHIDYVDPKLKNPPPPDYWLYEPEQGGGRSIVVPIRRKDEQIINEDTFKEKDPRLYNWIYEVTEGRVHFLDIVQTEFNPAQQRAGRTSATADLIKQTIGGYPEPKNRPMTAKERILRNLINPSLKDLAEGINGHLTDCGLPTITIPEQIFGEQKENINKYGRINSLYVDWGTYTLNYYKTTEELINYAKAKVRGKETDIEIKVTHQPRKYNPGKNWSPVRKTIKPSEEYLANPLTPKYKLPLRGLDVFDNNIVIGTELSIFGEPITVDADNFKYKWTIKLETAIGKKPLEQMQVSNIDSDIEIYSNTETDIMPISNSILVNDNIDITSISKITNAFYDALGNLRTKILNLNSKEILKDRYKNIDRADITLQPI
jgi:hypothetical protein